MKQNKPLAYDVRDRYRSRSTPQPSGTIVSNSTGAATSSSTVELPPLTSEQFYDRQVEQYHRRSGQGEIFNNPSFKVETKNEFNDLAVFSMNVFNPNMVTLEYQESHRMDRALLYYLTKTWGDLAVPIDTDELVRNAQIKALANVNPTDVDVLAFAGEWSKTKTLLRDVLNALWRGFVGTTTATRKKDRVVRLPVFDHFGNPKLNRKGEPMYSYGHTGSEVSFGGDSAGERLSNIYLVFRMGVVPLLNDLEEALKFLKSRYEPRYTARGTTTSQGQTTEETFVTSGVYGSYGIHIETTRTFEARYGLLYETDPFSRALANLGLTRPLSSAWQLMPWSFVADWLFQVGKYLDAIQPAGFTKTLSAWGSTRDTTVTTWTPTSRTPSSEPPWIQPQWVFTGSRLKQVVEKRRVQWDATIPSRPSSGTGLNQLRSADLVALMLQRIRSR